MSQIHQINHTLKLLLKQKQITYKNIADQLEMSEASIKRIFSTQSFTLDRLEQICSILKITLSDLFILSEKQTEKVSQLTQEQENELLASPKLLVAAICVRDSWSFQEMIDFYDISEHEGIQLMSKLDKLKVIEFLPNNHYRSLIAHDFRWLPGGPLEAFIEQEILSSFMKAKKGEKWDYRLYLSGRYSESSIEIIRQMLEKVAYKASALNQEDSVLPMSKRQRTGMLFAMRPWESDFIKSLQRAKQ
ncbi:helix-turn-helix domain-containing protein [Marinomonas balearica]|uniref:Xre family transcriptional regulator n=1 Tax=Marinomonas balearica TaxID=491947 RepID=A0A4R6M979_9GAMM|nr:helix-turn-helix transcriptional regulator [Marinomonas balearica]TDO96719.1 Xre family transcriptional regulator [Marinomonas balearica]